MDSLAPGAAPASCVAIPVCNEADRIEACLAALSAQAGAVPDRVVLLINNTTDDTRDIVERLAPALRFPVQCVMRDYDANDAHAGRARADAMAIAAACVGSSGLLLTTDADGRVAPDWYDATLAALRAGADVVCGRAEIDPVEAASIPAHLHEDDAREVAYATVLDRIHALADPDRFDPWPRHTEHSGASIAVAVAAWARAGGVPPLRNGEDRAFLRALRRTDHAIRHAPEVRVVVSGRTVGRASGGMADTMARRMIRQDEMLDDTLEPAALALRRAEARAGLRRLFAPGGSADGAAASVADYAGRVAVPASLVAALLRAGSPGAAWDAIEASSPLLRRRAVRRDQLAAHHAAAQRIVDRLLQRRETGLAPHRPPVGPRQKIEPIAVASVAAEIEPVLPKHRGDEPVRRLVARAGRIGLSGPVDQDETSGGSQDG
jgi:hypothetical protein